MRDIDDFNRLEEHAWRTETEMLVIQNAQNGDADAQFQLEELKNQSLIKE